MNKATTATSMPIRNRPALTPSITPKKGSTVTQMETTNPGGHISANEPGNWKFHLPGNIIEEEFKRCPH